MSGEALFWAARQQVGSVAERAVLWELSNLANKERGHVAWPSLATLVERCACGNSTVRKAIQALRQRGLIELQGSTIRRRYRLCLEAGIGEDRAAGQRDTAGGQRDTGDRQRNGAGPQRDRAGPQRDRASRQHRYYKDTPYHPDKDTAGTRPPAFDTSAERPARRLTGAAAVLAEEAAQWTMRLNAYRQDRFWPAVWGPPPGERGCLAPRSVLVQFGLAGQDAAADGAASSPAAVRAP